MKVIPPKPQFSCQLHRSTFYPREFSNLFKYLNQKRSQCTLFNTQTPINEKNIIYRLVQDDLKASHAGLSYWQGQYTDGQINLNASSIGIELVNLGFKDENNKRLWFAYTDHQIELLINLLKNLIEKYNIEPTRIIGHSDITPNIAARGNNVRVDPGPLFPWEKLAAAGIGAWYDRQAVENMLKNNHKQDIDILWLQKNLAIYGYNIQPTGVLDQQTRNVVTAFQMHFRPSDYSGTPDQKLVQF